MADEDVLRRPIGWWLKEADTGIDRAFDTVLDGTGIDRRRWQVLSTLAREPAPETDLATALRGFEDEAGVGRVVDDLVRRGLVERSQDRLRLTPQGAEQHRRCAVEVERVRHRVAAALPAEDYRVLVRLLARLVDALDEGAQAGDGA